MQGEEGLCTACIADLSLAEAGMVLEFPVYGYTKQEPAALPRSSLTGEERVLCLDLFKSMAACLLLC